MSLPERESNLSKRLLAVVTSRWRTQSGVYLTCTALSKLCLAPSDDTTDMMSIRNTCLTHIQWCQYARSAHTHSTWDVNTQHLSHTHTQSTCDVNTQHLSHTFTHSTSNVNMQHLHTHTHPLNQFVQVHFIFFKVLLHNVVWQNAFLMLILVTPTSNNNLQSSHSHRVNKCSPPHPESYCPPHWLWTHWGPQTL